MQVRTETLKDICDCRDRYRQAGSPSAQATEALSVPGASQVLARWARNNQEDAVAGKGGGNLLEGPRRGKQVHDVSTELLVRRPTVAGTAPSPGCADGSAKRGVGFHKPRVSEGRERAQVSEHVIHADAGDTQAVKK